MADQLFARSGRLISAEQYKLLFEHANYKIVRHFSSEQGRLSVLWIGGEYSIEGSTGVGWGEGIHGDGLQFSADEQSALNTYEDRLATMGCGEWVQHEDGHLLFMAIGNMQHGRACENYLEIERLILGDELASSSHSPMYGSW